MQSVAASLKGENDFCKLIKMFRARVEWSNHFVYHTIIFEFFLTFILWIINFIYSSILSKGCQDFHLACKNWSAVGECYKNAGWMLHSCCKSCSGIFIPFIFAIHTLKFYSLYCLFRNYLPIFKLCISPELLFKFCLGSNLRWQRASLRSEV